MFIHKDYFLYLVIFFSELTVALATGMDPSIHSDVLASDEGGALEIEHRVDDVRNFTYSSQRMKFRQLRMISLSVHRRCQRIISISVLP
jgi:hypothetical protein